MLSQYKKSNINDLRVLIVDDSPISVNIISNSISTLATVFVATDGEMAMSIVKKNQPDLILLDIEMPHVNGLEVCRRLKNTPEYAHIPIIFITANTHVETELEALGLGGIDYITKPINTDILRTRVSGQLAAVKRTKELVSAKKELSNLISFLPVFISYWNADAKNLFSNDLHGNWFAKTPCEMSGLSLFELFDEKTSLILDEKVALVKQGVNSILEVPIISAAKITRYAQASFISEQPFDGHDGFLIVMSDITDRKRVEINLLSAKEKADLTLESIGDAVIATDNEGVVTFINPIAEALTLWNKKDAVGEKVETVMPLIDSFTNEPLVNPVRTALYKKSIVGMPLDTILVNKQGDKKDVEDSASPILDKEGKLLGAIMVFHDVTEIKKKTIEKIKIATQDELTHLPNRYLFLDRAEQSIKKAQREKSFCGLLMIDIDGFSDINSTYGYVVGDRLIYELGLLLKEQIRDCDTLCRPGGDEFAILLASVSNIDWIAELCSRLLLAVDKEWQIEGIKFNITISIGIAIYPHDGLDASTLYRRADTAMREAKINGRNNYRFFAPAVEQHLRDQFKNAKRLRKAIDEDKISVYYQPKVSAKTGKIVGVEALVRWIQEDGSIIYPDKFIPLAEKTKLIIPLGKMVLYTACRQLVQWHQSQPDLTMSVNISAIQFNPALVATISDAIETTGIPANKLILEITESVLINDKHAIETIKSLKTLGIKLCMDDFGKGYSSLSYIKKFPLDVLKIDQSFVQQMLESKVDQSICETIVGLGNKLGLTVVAEGVETRLHVDMLLAMQCTLLQGYYYSKAVSASALSDLLLK